MLKKITLFFYTIRYLKGIQLFWRIKIKLISYFPNSEKINNSLQCRSLSLTASLKKIDSCNGDTFTFLNETEQFYKSINWQQSSHGKLWLYNLHYFDFLNQQQAIQTSLGYELINDWITNILPFSGDGWEPYPISLRIVNWIKYFSNHPLSDGKSVNIRRSLYLQSRYLFKHLEYHLLGNHLFKNGVALVFTGIYFRGSEAEDWLRKGKKILLQQIKEQILSDGGHFERSPMYHAIVLDDILDCINLGLCTEIFNTSEIELLKNKASIMADFLFDLFHPDGEIPFFNDAALGIAPEPNQLFQYATNLGIKGKFSKHSDKHYLNKELHVIKKPNTGYYIITNASSQLIVDAGPIGPDYLPGHAHCDTLSYELSIAGQRCIVNSGTYQYAGDFRNDFRTTGAHNTVRIDNHEQHEIWSTFRVARRGYPIDISVIEQRDCATFSAAHTGFKRLSGKPLHRRSIHCENQSIDIKDIIEGKGNHLAESFIHLHPNVEIISQSNDFVSCKNGEIVFSLHWDKNLDFSITKGWFSPEFGIKKETTVLVLRKKAECPFSLVYTISVKI